MKKIGRETPASAMPIAARSKTDAPSQRGDTPVADTEDHPDHRRADGERERDRQPVEQLGPDRLLVMNE